MNEKTTDVILVNGEPIAQRDIAKGETFTIDVDALGEIHRRAWQAFHDLLMSGHAYHCALGQVYDYADCRCAAGGAKR